jgi:tetraprenyl-beta-curcumene synthase
MLITAEHEQEFRVGEHAAAARVTQAGKAQGAGRSIALAGVFASAALRYWLSVFPRVRRELRRLGRHTGEIPDPVLRGLALAALAKRGNIEGAAAFAAFVPRRQRGATVRALTALQATYNYADMLAEQPSADPVANARRLHEALLVALSPSAAQLDYYAYCPRREDGGYLGALVDACRVALGELPCYPTVAEHARRAAARIVAFQSLSAGSGRPAGATDVLERWARAQTPGGNGLQWWETAAAGGSSLAVYALIAAAAAADSAIDPAEIGAIEEAYFPWIGALHSLLDSLVDEAEDERTGQLSLIGCYASREEAASGMRRLAARAMDAARALPRGREHAVLVAGMAASYLAVVATSETSEAPAPAAAAAAAAGTLAAGVREGVGGLARPAMLVFRVRRLGARRR